MFSGLRDVEVGDEAEVALGGGFSLVKPNECILSARDHSFMTEREFKDAARVSRYLVYKHEPTVPGGTYEQILGRAIDCEAIKGVFHYGLMAIQVLKPVRTLGVLIHGEIHASGCFRLLHVELRPPMEPAPWALKKTFDRELLKSVPSTIKSIQQIMEGQSAERRNALFLLQLGLEHFHPLMAGLLWVMGLDAIFDSHGRNDFKKKLCGCLGASTRALPGWKTVEEIAVPLYTLRSKLAHGVDLRKAASDPKYPVNLIEEHALPSSSERVPYALLLSEAASYLLCQVLQKEIA